MSNSSYLPVTHMHYLWYYKSLTQGSSKEYKQNTKVPTSCSQGCGYVHCLVREDLHFYVIVLIQLPQSGLGKSSCFKAKTRWVFLCCVVLDESSALSEPHFSCQWNDKSICFIGLMWDGDESLCNIDKDLPFGSPRFIWTVPSCPCYLGTACDGAGAGSFGGWMEG